MKDEEFVFKEDVREKSLTARSAKKHWTHGKRNRGARLPSDYMNKKEIEAMSGEVKSYRLNEPMTWLEFRAMPDDIKVLYIKMLREKFNVPDRHLAVMFGVSNWSVSDMARRLGINREQGGKFAWDSEGFYAWANGAAVKAEEPVEETQEEVPAEEVVEAPVAKEIPAEEIPFKPVTREFFEEIVLEKKAIPSTGTMVFEGNVGSILKSIGRLLGGANVHISVTWDVLEDD